MPTSIAAIDPTTGARGLLVEVHPVAPGDVEATLAAFCRRLFEKNIRVGLLVTPDSTMVVRDTLSTMHFSTNRFSQDPLETKKLLEHARVRVGSDLARQVLAWLEAVGKSWYSALDDSAVAAMVPDVVGHLVGASLETWDGLREAHDAAE